ncbi:MAG: polysaccharide deacetylase family protein [Endomicrobia bacterium]|nr:polysaccharide deacetylase family protein [Endomicrobiia bacterium]
MKEEKRQFVCLTFDDNGMSGLEGSGNSGGLGWLLKMVKTKPVDIKMTFFMSTFYIERDAAEKYEYVRKIWIDLYKGGHEIALHTHNHPHGSKFSVEDWKKELKKCFEMLVELGVRKDEIVGVRAPYLEYNDNLFIAAKRMGLLYDSSIEEGWQDNQDGTNFLFPYLLDKGSPGHRVLEELENKPPLSKHPGLWELPVYCVIVPPDEECEKYKVKPGFRKKMKQQQSYFDEKTGKISGLDYNLLVFFNMTKEEYLATLKYTLDLRLKGNRVPFIFCGHSDIYAKKYKGISSTTYEERQQALEEFIDYAIEKTDVRFTTLKELIKK